MDSNNAIKVMLSHMLDESFKTNMAVNAIVMKLMVIMALLYLVDPQFFLCNLHQH